MAYVDVTDTTFQTEVIDRSTQVPVVVDLWAEWCGPCKTLGPIIEKVIDETDGQVVLAKVDVDKNPSVSRAFSVQSIPAVYALRDGQVVDGFIGAQPEATVRDWVASLLPTETETTLADLIAAGDEASLRQALELKNDSAEAILALAAVLIDAGTDAGKAEALELLERIPETPESRHLAARARAEDDVALDDVESRLEALLPKVKADEDAKQEFLDTLELMGPDHPRTPEYRKKLTSALF